MIEEHGLEVDFTFQDYDGYITEAVFMNKPGTARLILTNVWDDKWGAARREEFARAQMDAVEHRRLLPRKTYTREQVLEIIRENERRMKSLIRSVTLTKTNLQVILKQGREVEIEV